MKIFTLKSMKIDYVNFLLILIDLIEIIFHELARNKIIQWKLMDLIVLNWLC